MSPYAMPDRPTLARNARRAMALGVLCLCAALIARSVLAGPPTRPMPEDARTAASPVQSRDGGPDFRAPMPDEGAVLGGNGVVEPADRERRVGAQVTAVIRTILVREGEVVQAGAPLVQLEDQAERAALLAAEAELGAARAELARVAAGLRPEDRTALLADERAAQARAARSAGEVARAEALFQASALSAAELDRARREAEVDDAAAEAAGARRRAAESGRSEDVALARARVAAGEARAAEARAAMERLLVRAPASGEILQVLVRPGELYSSQLAEPLLIMGDTRQLRVRLDVDERDVARLSVGAPAWVVADAYGQRRFEGEVVEIGRRFGRKNVRTDDPVERNDTRVIEAVIELRGGRELVPGQRVTGFVGARPVRRS